MPTDSRRSVGALGEQLAERHLVRRGYSILDRNYRTRFGELDLIAAGADCVVFCEVKTRIGKGGRGSPSPLESIGSRKRQRLRLMARQWLGESSARATAPGADWLRFDAIGVTLTRAGGVTSLEHVEDAF